MMISVDLLGNASCLIRTSRGNILCDPWLTEPAFDSWYHDPPLKVKPEDVTDYDWIYISHIHPDHFDAETLKRLEKRPVLLCRQADSFLERAIEQAGFEVIPLQPWDYVDADSDVIPPISAFPAFAPNALVDAEIPNILDSSLAVYDGDEILINFNDNTPTPEACRKLLDFFGKSPDIALMPYSGAGDFPSCHRGLRLDEKRAKHRWKVNRYLDRLVECADILKPKTVIPFAGQYVLGGSPEMRAKNEVLGIPPVSEAVERLRRAGHHVPDMSAWEPTGRVVPDTGFAWESMKDDDPRTTFELVQVGFKHLRAAQERFGCFPPWLVQVKTELSTYYLPLSKDMQTTGRVLTLHVPERMLRLILLRRLHMNNMQVGAHIDFERVPDEYDPDIYTLICFFHLPRNSQ